MSCITARKTGLALLSLLAPLAMIAGPAEAAPTAGPGPAVQSPALERVGACMVAKGHGDVLLLLDTSSSLKSTDKLAARVTAARFLLDQFVGLSQRTRVGIDLAVSGFADSYQPAVGWVRLSAGGVRDGVYRRLGDFGPSDNGFETDYWTALDGARQDLRRHARRGDCQMVVWFTDGQYELSARTNGADRDRYGRGKPYAPGVDIGSEDAAASVARAGAADLCRPGGLADQLRTSGIALLAVGLGAKDFSFLQGVSTGRDAAGHPCGRQLNPRPGDFWRVSNLDDLLFVFARLGAPDRPGSGGTGGVCPGGVSCRLGTHQFVLDRSIRSVQILASASRDDPDPARIGLSDVDIHLQAPGVPRPLVLRYRAGDEQRPARATGLGGVPVTFRWLTPQTVSVTLTEPPTGPWTGAWQIVFIRRGPADRKAYSRIQIQIEGDLTPARLDQPPVALRAGDVAHGLRVGVARAQTGQAVSPNEILGTIRLDADLVGPGGTVVPVLHGGGADAIDRTYDADLTRAPPGHYQLRMRLGVTTAGVPASGGRPGIRGTALSGKERQVDVEVLPPLGFPPVDTTPVDLGSAVDLAPLHGAVRVTGPGCVWLAGSDIQTTPHGVDRVTVRADSGGDQAHCVQVGDGQQAELPITVTRSTTGRGTVNGVLRVGTAARTGADAKAVTVEVPFTGDLDRSPRGLVRWSVFAIFLIGGLLVPVVVAYGLNWYGARIPGKRALSAAAIDVELSGREVLRGGAPFRFDHNDVIPVGGWSRSGTRRLVLPDCGVELRTRVRPNPAVPGYVVADTGGIPAASGAPPYTDGTGLRARLPLAVHNNWLVLLDDPVGLRPRVVVMVSGDAEQDKYDQLAGEIQQRLADRVAELRRAAGSPVEADPVAAGDSWRGSDSDSDTGTGGWRSPSPATGWRSTPHPRASTPDIPPVPPPPGPRQPQQDPAPWDEDGANPWR